MQNSQIEWRARLTTGDYHLRQLAPGPRRPLATELKSSVTYVWCAGSQKRRFTFRHFLGVRSALIHLRPNVVHFYCDKYIEMDIRFYNTWLNELRQQYPYFIVHKIKKFSQACEAPATPKIGFIKERLEIHGGFFVSENIIFSRSLPAEILEADATISVTEEETIGFVSMMSTPEGLDALERETANIHNFVVSPLRCGKPHWYLDDPTHLCIDHSAIGTYFPKDLWCTNDSFSKLASRYLYGTDELPYAQPNDHEVVPRIAHYIWFGGGNMDFFFYLSVLSCLYVLKVEGVYIHGDLPPSGPNWQKLQNEQRLHWIYRHRPGYIFDFKLKYLAHEADVAAADVMVQYGGIHVDPDLVFSKPLHPVLWRYDAVASPARVLNPPFPSVINWGVFLGKPNSAFWWLVQRAQRQFLVKEWNWNSARVLYKIYERNPELLYLSPYLQVMCYRSLCLPQWPSKSMHRDRWMKNLTNWMDDVFSFHFTEATPYELSSSQIIKKNKGPFSKLGRRILKSAGRIWAM